jgi:hypothetical protein
MRGRSSTVTILWFVGMICFYLAARLLGPDSGWRGLIGWAGLILVLASLGLRVMRTQKATGEVRRVESWLLLLASTGLLAVCIYQFNGDVGTKLLGDALAKSSPKLSTVLAALWPAMWLGSALPLFLGELSYAAVARAPRLEAARIRDALLTGLGLAAALTFCFAAVYTAAVRDKSANFSYMHTARPGESTRKIVHTLDAPVQVALFFPPANDVHEQVEAYFTELVGESKLLDVKSYDHAADPSVAKQLGVSGNGIIVVAKGSRKEQLNVGLEIEAARDKLANLDREVQKRLLQVAKPQRNIYLTSGHGERTFDPMNDTDKRSTVRELRELLQQQGYGVRSLGAAEGLGSDVPGDAAVVLLIGPQKPLFPEEVASLQRFVDRGGRVLVALDPEAKLDQKELLASWGLTYSPVMLANDQVFARKSYQPSDRANLATGSFSSHASVTSLGHLGMRAPMILPTSGHLEEIKDHSKDVSVSFTVHAHPSTYDDPNGDFDFNPPKAGAPGETRKPWELAAAVTKKHASAAKAGPDQKNLDAEGRVLAVADSDAISDGVVGNPGNAYFVIDGMKWLLGDEAIAGEINSEADTKIAHTKQQDQVWFYTPVFAAPAAAIGAGFAATRRRRKGKKQGKRKEAA